MRNIKMFRNSVRILYTLLIGINSIQQASAEQQWQIKPTFDYALPHAENGLAAVSFRGKWGYINRVGEGVIRPQWDLAASFFEDRALVKKKERWSYIAQDGTYPFRATFQAASHFRNSVAVVMDDSNFGTINTEGEWITKFSLEELGLDAKKSFPNIVGGSALHSQRVISTTSQGNYLVAYHKERKNYFSFIFKKDGSKVPFLDQIKWRWISPPTKSGIAVQADDQLLILGNDRVLFDSKEYKKKQFSSGYFSSVGFFEGVAAIKVQRPKDWARWAYMDSTGKIVVDFRADNSGNSGKRFSQNLGVYSKKGNGPRGYVNKSGKIVIKPQWDAVTSFSPSGFALAVGKKEAFIINTAGESVSKIKYDTSKDPLESRSDHFFKLQGQYFTQEGKSFPFKDDWRIDLKWPVLVPEKKVIVAFKNGNKQREMDWSWDADSYIYDMNLVEIAGPYPNIFYANLTDDAAFTSPLINCIKLENGYPAPDKESGKWGYLAIPKND